MDIWNMVRRLPSEELTDDEATKLLTGVIVESAREYFAEPDIDANTRMYDIVHSVDELPGFEQCLPCSGYRIALKDSMADIARGISMPKTVESKCPFKKGDNIRAIYSQRMFKVMPVAKDGRSCEIGRQVMDTAVSDPVWSVATLRECDYRAYEVVV